MKYDMKEIMVNANFLREKFGFDKSKTLRLAWLLEKKDICWDTAVPVYGSNNDEIIFEYNDSPTAHLLLESQSQKLRKIEGVHRSFDNGDIHYWEIKGWEFGLNWVHGDYFTGEYEEVCTDKAIKEEHEGWYMKEHDDEYQIKYFSDADDILYNILSDSSKWYKIEEPKKIDCQSGTGYIDHITLLEIEGVKWICEHSRLEGQIPELRHATNQDASTLNEALELERV